MVKYSASRVAELEAVQLAYRAAYGTKAVLPWRLRGAYDKTANAATSATAASDAAGAGGAPLAVGKLTGPANPFPSQAAFEASTREAYWSDAFESAVNEDTLLVEAARRIVSVVCFKQSAFRELRYRRTILDSWCGSDPEYAVPLTLVLDEIKDWCANRFLVNADASSDETIAEIKRRLNYLRRVRSKDVWQGPGYFQGGTSSTAVYELLRTLMLIESQLSQTLAVCERVHANRSSREGLRTIINTLRDVTFQEMVLVSTLFSWFDKKAGTPRARKLSPSALLQDSPMQRADVDFTENIANVALFCLCNAPLTRLALTGSFKTPGKSKSGGDGENGAHQDNHNGGALQPSARSNPAAIMSTDDDMEELTKPEPFFKWTAMSADPEPRAEALLAPVAERPNASQFPTAFVQGRDLILSEAVQEVDNRSSITSIFLPKRRLHLYRVPPPAEALSQRMNKAVGAVAADKLVEGMLLVLGRVKLLLPFILAAELMFDLAGEAGDATVYDQLGDQTSSFAVSACNALRAMRDAETDLVRAFEVTVHQVEDDTERRRILLKAPLPHAGIIESFHAAKAAQARLDATTRTAIEKLEELDDATRSYPARGASRTEKVRKCRVFLGALAAGRAGIEAARADDDDDVVYGERRLAARRTGFGSSMSATSVAVV